jgi:hypothetical protein
MKKQWLTDNLAKGGIGYKDIVCFTNGRHINKHRHNLICMIADMVVKSHNSLDAEVTCSWPNRTNHAGEPKSQTDPIMRVL